MWSAIVSTIVGLWVMVSPSVFETTRIASNNNYIVGPLLITFSIISFWDINRNVIKVNMLPGTWLLVSAFVFDYPQTVFYCNIASGVVIIILSNLKRKSVGKVGGGWRSLFQRNPLDLREAEKIADKNQ